MASGGASALAVAWHRPIVAVTAPAGYGKTTLLAPMGRLAEIGPGDLALTEGEAASLLDAAEVVLDQDEVAELHRPDPGVPAPRRRRGPGQ